MENTEDSSKYKIYSKILKSMDNPSIIKIDDIHSLSNEEFIYVIGEESYKKIVKLDISKSINFILLGIYLPPEDIHLHDNWKSISLFISEESVYNKIKSYSKIYSSYKDDNDWYYQAFKNNKQFHFKLITSKKDAINYYRDIAQNISNNDIFLINPHGFFDKTTISELLRLSWENQFKTFSVLPSHSKKGFLLSPYFTKNSIHDFLKEYDNNIINQPKIKGIYTNNFSINSRTAKHIGIRRSYIDTFKVIY